MAEPISIQQLKDASEDAITLADFIYKPANVMIPRRLAEDINSLQYYLEYMKSFAQRSYETYDEMVTNASNLSENVSVFVTNDSDTSKNGIYTYNGTSFVRGEYQPENAAKEFVEAKLGEFLFDGKVRAQDVVDDSLTQQIINRGLESISDLSTINNPKDGLRVYVKSYHAGLNKGGGYFTYNSADESLDNRGTIINGWTRDYSNKILLEDFGAYGDGTTDDTEYFNLAGIVQKENPMMIVQGISKSYLLKGIANFYGAIDILGEIKLLKTASTVAGLRVLDSDTRYDVIDLTDVTDIEALSNVVTGLPADSETKFMSIHSSENINRYNSGEMQYYTKNHYAQIRRSTGSIYVSENLRIHPRVPYSFSKDSITSIRIYRPRHRISVNLGSIKILNKDAIERGLSSAVIIGRDSVDLTYATYSQEVVDNGYYNQFNMTANDFHIRGGSFIHTAGTAGSNSYGFLIGGTCNSTIEDVRGTTNWHNVVSRHASNFTIRNCELHDVDEHMGSNFKIYDCTLTRVSFAGSDLHIENSTIYSSISLRGDTPICRGNLTLENIQWYAENSKLVLPSSSLPGNFNYPASFFDYVNINNITVHNAYSPTGEGGLVYSTSDTIYSPSNKQKGWAYNEAICPKEINISNVRYINPTGWDSLSTIGVGLKNENYGEVCKVSIKNISFTPSMKEDGLPRLLNPIDVRFQKTTEGTTGHITTEDDIKLRVDITITDVPNCAVYSDFRLVDNYSIMNCHNVMFYDPSHNGNDRVGGHVERKWQGTVNMYGGSALASSSHDRVRSSHFNFFNTIFQGGLPVIENASRNVKILKMHGCVSDSPNTFYYSNNDLQYSFAPMQVPVSNLPTNAVAGAIAYATNGRKVGEIEGSGSGVLVYYDKVSSQWMSTSEDTPVLS